MTAPAIGSVHNYGGDNYAVTRVEPGKFLCLGQDNGWEDAVEFTDHVKEGETATLSYVCTLADFNEYYQEGEIEEGAEASQELPDGAPPKPTQLPAQGIPPAINNELPPTASGKPVDDPADGLG